MTIPQFCEIAMLCLFGCSWPFNIAKALKAKTAKGKSIGFELLILTGQHSRASRHSSMFLTLQHRRVHISVTVTISSV